MPRPTRRSRPLPAWEKTGETQLGSLPVRRYRLPNGLTVVTCPDPHALTVAFTTWFAVGSRDEEASHTGLAHLFEHLMFTQTKTQKDGAFDATIEGVGGNSNAHTSQDTTAYVDVVPPAALPTVVALEADRMLNLDLRARQVQTEKEVVLEEWASVLLDDVDGRIEEALWRQAFATHPYGRSILGEKADLEAVTPEAAIAFYRRHYGPRRAAIVVVGPFEEEATLALIAESYADLPSQPAEARDPLPADEAPRGPREATLTAPLPAPRLAVAHGAPGFGDPDRVAFEILAEGLAGGRSSRLGAELVVRSGEVSALESDVALTSGAGLWTVAAQLHRGKAVRDTAARMNAAFAEAGTRPFTEAELAAAENRWESALWQSARSAEGKAELLGSCEVIGGDVGLCERRLAAAKAVTSADLQALAARLRPDARVQVTVTPPPEATQPEVSPAPPRGDGSPAAEKRASGKRGKT